MEAVEQGLSKINQAINLSDETMDIFEDISRQRSILQNYQKLIKVSGISYLEIANIDQLKMAINSGPVIVHLCITNPAIKLYSSGIFDLNSECQTDEKQAVTAIGYGKESEKEYLLIKNSWGTSWGEKGFMKYLLRDGQISNGKKSIISSLFIIPLIEG